MGIFKNRPLALSCFVFVLVFFVCSLLPSVFILFLLPVTAVSFVVLFRKNTLYAVICIIVAFGCIFGYCYFEIYVSGATQVDDGVSVFEVVDIQYSSDAVVYADCIDDSGYKYHYTINNSPEIYIGDILKGDVKYKEIQNSDGFDSVKYYNAKNIWLEAEVESPDVIGHNNSIIRSSVGSIRDYCHGSIEKHTEPEVVGILSALSLGDKAMVDDSVIRDFSRSGLSHVMAISGMHLSVVMGLIAVICESLSIDPRIRSLIITVLCVCYILIAGASSSVLRAGVMFIIMSAGSFFRRRSDSLTNLMLAVALIIIFSPSSVFDIGLLLSFTATFGIIVIVGNFIKKKERGNRKTSRKVFDWVIISVITSVSAQAFSFIPMIVYFDSISLLTIISNLIISPIVTLLLLILPIFLGFAWVPFLGSGIAVALEFVTTVLTEAVGFISSIPYSVISLDFPFVSYTYIAIAVGIAAVFFIRKRLSLIIPFLSWLVTISVCFGVYNITLISNYEFVFYSYASSDAVFMRNSGGCVYFDLSNGSKTAESRAYEVLEKELCTSELDSWVITVYTDDIHEQAYDLMNEYYIRKIYVPEPYDKTSYYVARELEYYAGLESVDVIYYKYDKNIDICGADVSVYDPVWFENNDVSISALNISFGERDVFYAGRGYFDHYDSEMRYDVLFLGENGSKRKLVNKPDMYVTKAIIAEGITYSSDNIDGTIRRLSENTRYVKLRLKNIY